MKTFKNLVIGGIENKVVNLILITIIVLTAAFWGVGEYQNRMLEEVSTETVQKQEEALADITVPLKVAVMGCVVNGLGEGREADVGIAGGKSGGVLFVKGKEPRKVEGNLAEALISEARIVARERAK